MTFLEKIKTMQTNTIRTVDKHSPAILAVGGLVTLGVGIWQLVQATRKVDAIISEVEASEKNGEVVDKVEVAIKVGKAVAPAALCMIGSVGCFAGSYSILNKRLSATAAALTVATADYSSLKERVVQHLDEEIANRVLNVEKAERYDEETGKNTNYDKPAAKHDLHGAWIAECSEFCSDDMSYNINLIVDIERRMESIISRKGAASLNDLFDMLGHEKFAFGEIMEFRDSFWIDYTIVQFPDTQTGEMTPTMSICWTKPSHKYY